MVASEGQTFQGNEDFAANAEMTEEKSVFKHIQGYTEKAGSSAQLVAVNGIEPLTYGL
jgi:hypothetical protein